MSVLLRFPSPTPRALKKFVVYEKDLWICRNPESCGGRLASVRDLSGSVTEVCEEKEGECLGPYKALASEELDPNTVGFLAEVSRALAEAGVPLMVYSTFERDYVLVPAEALERAVEALEAAGFWVRFWEAPPTEP